MSALMRLLTKSGVLEGDLDYHLVRASMVILFALLRVPEMVRLRGAGIDSVHQQRPFHLRMSRAHGGDRRGVLIHRREVEGGATRSDVSGHRPAVGG